jgi:hypothetical protein|tara:strand:+ start:381 stop:656 length:276 start_codon:yes stop_codon:yes gene_type:complete
MSKERHDEYMARMTAEEKLIASEKQIGGNHYKDRVIQPIDYIVKNNLDFLEGNVVKYITRWREKGGIEDLKKAKHYLELKIEFEINREKEK